MAGAPAYQMRAGLVAAVQGVVPGGPPRPGLRLGRIQRQVADRHEQVRRVLGAVAARVAAGQHDAGQLGDRQARLEPRGECLRITAARGRVDERQDGLTIPDQIDRV